MSHHEYQPHSSTASVNAWIFSTFAFAGMEQPELKIKPPPADATGALHHIMGRGVERRVIFADDEDRNTFLRRLEKILIETKTVCLAWALIPNHFHLLLRTGTAPIATIMRRLLTGYAQYYNRRHKRHGQLFQNRYKSILCQEELNAYPFSGHSVLMGTAKAAWQDVCFVLGHFGEKSRSAGKEYHAYVDVPYLIEK